MKQRDGFCRLFLLYLVCSDVFNFNYTIIAIKLMRTFFLSLLAGLLLMICMPLHSHAQDDLDFQELMKEVDSSGIFFSSDNYTWCSSVVKGEDGKYHMFYSRWSHGKRIAVDDSMNYIFDGFRGWNKYSEIASAVSDNLEGPYKHVTTVLKGDQNPDSWQRFTMHN